MIIPLSTERASIISKEFMEGTIRKEYIARCKGKFPAWVVTIHSDPEYSCPLSEEIICEEPLLTVDRQMGLNIVHPEGKVCVDTVTRKVAHLTEHTQ